MKYKHTPIRIINKVVYAWIKGKDGIFYLGRPNKNSIILYHPWVIPHVTNMANPE